MPLLRSFRLRWFFLLMPIPALLLAQSPLVRRLQSNAVPVSLGRIDGQLHLTGYLAESSGWSGFHTLLDEQLAPTGPAKSWPMNLYHEAMSTHKLANGHWLSFGRSFNTTGDRYLYFVEHDAQGTIHAAHKWVDTTSTLTTISYAYAYNADSSQLLTTFQNQSLKGFVCFDRDGEVLWAKRLNYGNMIFPALLAASDGGWYAFGQMSFDNYNFDPILVKLDAQGGWEWTRRYGMAGSDESVLQATPTNDGGLLLSATTIIDTVQFDQPNYGTLLRTDANGELLWHRVIGRDGGPGQFQGGSAIELGDGTVLWAGSAKDTIAGTFVNGTMFFLHLDPDGEVISTAHYAHPGGGDADHVKFLNTDADHPILTARVYDGQTYARELIAFGPDLLPPCDIAPLSYALQPWAITEVSLTQSTQPFTLQRDTLVLTDPPITISSELACISTGAQLARQSGAPLAASFQQGHLFVDIPDDPGACMLRVNDARGKLIAVSVVTGRSGRIDLSLPAVASGVLTVSLLNSQGERMTTRLFVVP